MRLVSQLQKVLLQNVFKRMILLNNIEIRSFMLAVVFLSLKTILGIWLILTIFIGDEQIQVPLMTSIKNVFRSYLNSSTNTTIVLTVIFAFMNGSSVFLYFRPSESGFSQKLSRILLILMQMFECFQYLGIIILCCNIQIYMMEKNYFMVILGFINLVLFFALISIFKAFYFTISHGIKNILGRFPSTHNVIVQLLSMLLTIILTFVGHLGLNQSNKIIFSILFLVLKTLTINYSLGNWHFVNPTIQCVYSFFQIIEFIALLFNLLLEITKQPLMGENYYTCVLITSTFFFLGWRNYFLHEQEAVYFFKGKDIKLASQAALYFKALLDLSGKGQTQNDCSLLLSSIRKQHEIQCSNLNCYCKRINLDEQFAKDYIIEQLDEIRIHFKNQPKILIQELNFRFKMFKTYPDVLTRIGKIRKIFTLSIIQQFSITSLKTDLIEYMADRNRSANTIDVETPLNLQQTTRQIEKIIDEDIGKKEKKWKYLAQGLCRTEELQDDTKTQISYIKQIHSIQHKWNAKMKRSTIFNYLLLFYYKKVSFLHVNVDVIYKNINQAMNRVKEEELSSVKQFAKCLFHKRSCVIESPINEDDMGIVTRASKNVFDLFGYQQNKIVGINLNRLMPNFMAIQHDTILSQWVKNGTWRTVGKLKQIFCIHKDQYCFNASLYLKIVANQKGLFFITIIFKKNESDYLILNGKKEIQGIGRKFLQVIGNNCRKLPVQILFDNFPENQIPKNFEYKTFTRTFRSFRNNQYLVDEFFQNKSSLNQKDNSLDDLVRAYQQRLDLSSNLQKWEVKFNIKVQKMRQVRFYVILLNHARVIASEDKLSLSTFEHGKEENILVGHGKMNEDEDSSFHNSKNSSQSTAGQRQQKFMDDKGSSVSSYAERQNFTLMKLLSVFFSYTIRPKNIDDQRVSTLNISTLLQALALTAIITFSISAYTGTMNEIKEYINADAEMNQNLQRVLLLYGRVISFQEYKNDEDTVNEILWLTLDDMRGFYESAGQQLGKINSGLSSYSGQKLFKYLNEPINFNYQNQKNTYPIEIQSLFLFQFYYHITGTILNDIYQDSQINFLQDRTYQLSLLKRNFPQLKKRSKQFSNRFIQLSQLSINNITNIDNLMTSLYAIISVVFFVYSVKYYYFRHNQKYECLHIYNAIPTQLLHTLKNYYHQLSLDFRNNQNSKTGVQANFHMLTSSHQLTLQQNTYSTNNAHIKFLGKKRFSGWIKPIFTVLFINIVNTIITFEVIGFISPLDKLVINVNNLINAENDLFQLYLQLKAAYFLSEKSQITDSLLNDIIETVSKNQVAFNHMATITTETLILYDPNFQDDFKKILTTNVCEQLKSQLTQDLYSYCTKLSHKSMISEGIITFMNHMHRQLIQSVVDLKQNPKLRQNKYSEQNYFINQGFREIDLSMGFNIKIYRKLTQRMAEAYQKGVDYVTIINYVIVAMLLTPQVISLMLWFYLSTSEKKKLSFLYGSVLTIPPQIIKQVKNLPRLAKKILQFSQT